MTSGGGCTKTIERINLSSMCMFFLAALLCFNESGLSKTMALYYNKK